MTLILVLPFILSTLLYVSHGFQLNMIAPKPSGFSNTKEGKVVIFERTKKLLDQSAIILSVPVAGVTKEQTDMLRKELPVTVKASVVKNAIMRRVSEGTKFEQIKEGLKQQNMFFFVPEGEAKKTMTAFKKWQKEIKRTEPEFDVKVGVMDNAAYTGPSLDTVVNLPTKIELITQIAQRINAVPTKLARSVKAVPTKVGRAFAAVRDQMEEKEKAVNA